MIDDIALFIHIVRHRGLAQAAAQLKVSAATLTRRLQKLEENLSCKLIHRSARKFVLTPEGEAHYRAYADLVTQFEATQRNLSNEMHDMKGKLRVLAPTNISIGALQPMWSRFIAGHPDIQLELLLGNQVEDLLTSQAELALRIGPQQDSMLHQKRLGSITTVLVASPDYLKSNGVPENVAALNQHRLIGTNTIPIWKLKNNDSGTIEDFIPQLATLANDIGMVGMLARDGLGISLLPLTEVGNMLQDGKLIRVMPNLTGPERTLYAVWPTGKLLSAKAQHLKTFMENFICKALT